MIVIGLWPNISFSDFCWTCLGDWKTHGSQYYKCSRYKENPDIVNQSQKAQAREALKKYLFYFERVRKQRVKGGGEREWTGGSRGTSSKAALEFSWLSASQYLNAENILKVSSGLQFTNGLCVSCTSGRTTTSLCSWRLRRTRGSRRRSRREWWTAWEPGLTGSTFTMLQSFSPRYFWFVCFCFRCFYWREVGCFVRFCWGLFNAVLGSRNWIEGFTYNDFKIRRAVSLTAQLELK